MSEVDLEMAYNFAPQFLTYAYKAARNSPDPSNQNGAVYFTHELHKRISGYNHFPNGIEFTEELLQDRDWKITHIEHAERDLIASAAAEGISLKGSIVYCPWFACTECARMLSLAGVSLIVGHKQRMDMTPERWISSVEAGNTILDKGGVKRLYYDRPLELDFTITVNGQPWRP